MDDQFVRTTIATLAREPQPACEFTVETALRNGRRWLRIRRAAASVGAALALVGTVGAFEIIGRRGEDRLTAAGRGPVTDPLIRGADFGWLPQAYSVRKYRVSGRSGPPIVEIVAAPQAGVALPPSDTAAVSFGPPEKDDSPYAGIPGEPRPIGSGGGSGGPPYMYDLERAPSVNGHRAFWLNQRPILGRPVTTHGVVRLRWEYAKRAWAELMFLGDREGALRVARGVKTTGREKLRFPFRIRDVAADLRVRQSNVLLGAPGSGVWEAELTLLGDTLAATEGGLPEKRHELHVNVMPDKVRLATKNAPPTKRPNRMIDGYRAVYNQVKIGRVYHEELYVLGVQGLTYRVFYNSLEGNAAERIWRSLQTFGADPARWTDRPLG